MFIFLLLMTLLIAIIYVSMIATQDKENASDAKRGNLQKKQKTKIPASVYIKWYKIFSKNPFTKREFKMLELRYSEMAVYTPQEYRIKAVQSYALPQLAATILVIIVSILYRDLFISLIVLLFVQVIKQYVVYKQLDKVQFEVLLELKMALSSIRERYQICQTVPDAINEAEIPKLLVNSFDDIYMILTGSDAERRLDNMYQTNPYRLIQTLAGICHIIHETGDSETASGETNFMSAMLKVQEEVNLEILAARQTQLLFRGVTVLPVIPVFMIPVLQGLMTANVPSITYMYKGTFGMISRIVILVTSMIVFSIVTKMTKVNSIARNDRWSIITWLLRYNWFSKFIDEIKPIHGARRRAKRKILKKAISAKSIEHLYGEKVLCAVLIFIFCLSGSIIAIITGRSMAYNNYTYKTFTADEHIDEKELAVRIKLDAEYLDKSPMPSEDATKEMLAKVYPKMSEYDLLDQTDRLMSKYKRYHNTYFAWWILALIGIISYVGWMLPDFILLRRAKAVKAESDDDTLQMQNIVSILMYTPIDTLDALYWLARQSNIHKDALNLCCQNYASNPYKALDELKRSDPTNSTFVRMCNKLILTINQISLKDAFSDIEADRHYIMQLREMNTMEAIKNKRTIAGALAMAPMLLTAILCLVVPIGVLSVGKFKEGMSESV